MPIRVKSKPLDKILDHSAIVRSPSPVHETSLDDEGLPDIEHNDSFRDVVKKLSVFLTARILLPSTFEQLRTTSVGDALRELVLHLSRNCTNPAIVNALLALKWHYGHYSSMGSDKGLMDARANSCEIVAWRFLTHLSEREAVDFCLYEIPARPVMSPTVAGDEESSMQQQQVDEQSPLLSRAWDSMQEAGREASKAIENNGSTKRYQLLQSLSNLTMSMSGESSDDDDESKNDPTGPFVNLNALEIAAIADAKRFLGQNIVQKIITGIWNGDIIFWDSLSVHATKKPRFYNPKTADVFSRLRVPKYLKCYEVLFFASFLFLYYMVLIHRSQDHISTQEVFLFIWLGAFLYDELSEWIDAGSIFYAADVWNIFDVIMISIGIIFAILRIVGLTKLGDPDTHGDGVYLIELAYDILSLEALFMVPRVASILSLSPYWGTLIPCLKEMGKDFVKFMVLVVIVYLGFLTTFTLIGRDRFDGGRMTLILTKIFFGNSGTGFDVMYDIDGYFGPPLMITFIMLSSILLMGSLTGMLSNSFSRVITHAREEYLYVYSVYVLEASTSNRLTHFYPPLNLMALVLFRPLRLFLRSTEGFRQARILLLKATHLPVVAAIQVYELVTGRLQKGSDTSFKGPSMHPESHSSMVDVTGASPHLRLAGRHSSYRPHTADPAKPFRGPGRPSISDVVWRPSVSPQPRPRHSPDDKPCARADRPTDAAEDNALGLMADAADSRLAQLSQKIDRLTDLVLRMQSQQTQPLADVPVP